MADQFLKDQIEQIKNEITALNAAILALTANPHKSYNLDTGQSKQSVTREDLQRLGDWRDSLLNQYYTLTARCDGSGVTRGAPCW